MGIQAPTAYDKFLAIQSALLSYNRPLILTCVFAIIFLLMLLLSKRNILLSFLTSFAIVFILALYYVITSVSRLRY